MEKFNQTPIPVKVESETVGDVVENTETVEASSHTETTEEYATPSGVFINDIPSSSESSPESPSEKITRLHEQKTNTTA